jgi:hypothetical protein
LPQFAVRPEAEQFTGEESIEAVADLVRKYRPRCSYEFSPALRTLRFYDSGRELKLKMWDYVAVIRGDIAVIPPSMIPGSIVSESE